MHASSIVYALAAVATGVPPVGIKAVNGVVIATENKQKKKLAQNCYLTYREPIPTSQLVQKVATVMQEYMQSGGVRSFGVSLLICDCDEGRPYL
ncbi:proteasome subunit alpha type-2-like [Anopheles ziemanni]|uniref:proteasome subunit alpha type-2-like n=1 Tax=Anopheles coustani TaxID=139045 RepID=UPI002659C8BE|nr:proteasome subunit alpha type-2-like [Anopheles coustani]XP_058177838.1 proteasome subunit alpha type-2-like [Anopheles ziemanni]